MGTEIERKFLLASDDWRHSVRRSSRLRQGYLGGRRCSVRVRVADAKAWINIKSLELGARRDEYEYPIPLADAEAMLATLVEGPVLSKTRHLVEHSGSTWEIDEFDGDNAGLVVAEIELEALDQPFARPGWLGREVTELPRYYNVRLVQHPYCRWSAEEREGLPC